MFEKLYKIPKPISFTLETDESLDWVLNTLQKHTEKRAIDVWGAIFRKKPIFIGNIAEDKFNLKLHADDDVFPEGLSPKITGHIVSHDKSCRLIVTSEYPKELNWVGLIIISIFILWVVQWETATMDPRFLLFAIIPFGFMSLIYWQMHRTQYRIPMIFVDLLNAQPSLSYKSHF